MKRIFTIILIGFVYAAMSYSLTPQTEHIYAFLKKMFFIENPEFYYIANTHTPDYLYAQVYDLKTRKSLRPHDQDTLYDFNMEFGAYMVYRVDVFLLTYRDSVFAYHYDNLGVGLDEFTKKIISIIKENPTLVSMEDFVNIVDNLYARPIVFGRPLIPVIRPLFEYEGINVFIYSNELKATFDKEAPKLTKDYWLKE